MGGLPTLENTSLDIQGYSVPYTTYARDNEDTYWLLGVYKYPSVFDMSDVSARLGDALDSTVQNTQGATLTNSEYIQLDDRAAISAKYTVTQSDQSFGIYYLSTLLDNTMYTLLSAGGNKSDFNTFIESFHVAY